jgi:hypothetical protein
MSQFVHAVFLVATACVAPMSSVMTAYAQDTACLCAGKGDDDRVREIPAGLVPDAQRLFGFSPDSPSAFIQKSTSFRCMGGNVWLCNYGANLVCGKANVSRTSAGAAEFCRENPGSDVVPMAATGHDTIYDWNCVGNREHISRRIVTVDPRGFIAENWKRLK